VAYGKPVVATRGTWMAEQIEAGRAAGTIFEDLEPDSIARAIARCVVDLKSLQQSAPAPEHRMEKQRRHFGIRGFYGRADRVPRTLTNY
jgi:glycosyltransferase involved in cell wall biosynthesis